MAAEKVAGKAPKRAGEPTPPPDPVAPATTAYTGRIACRRPAAAGPAVSHGGVVLAELAREMRPTKVVIESVGPPRPTDSGQPGLGPEVHPGETLVVPEYGVIIVESVEYGEIRYYEHSQPLAVLLPDDDPRTLRAGWPAPKAP